MIGFPVNYFDVENKLAGVIPGGEDSPKVAVAVGSLCLAFSISYAMSVGVVARRLSGLAHPIAVPDSKDLESEDDRIAFMNASRGLAWIR